MKKLFAMLLVLCMTLSLAALAESHTLIDPFSDGVGVSLEADQAPEAEEPDPEAEEPDPEADETSHAVVVDEPTPVPAAAAQSAAEPEGMELYMYGFGASPDYGDIMVSEVILGDSTTARDAGENSMVIPAKPGNKVMDVRLVFNVEYNNGHETLPVNGIFSAQYIIGDTAYPCRLYIESGANGKIADAGSTDVDFSDCALRHLYDTEGATQTIGNSSYRYFYMFDAIAQIPEAALTEGTPVYIQLFVGGKTFWCQVK